MKNNIIYTDESLAVDSKNTFKDKIIKFVNKHAEIWKFIKFLEDNVFGIQYLLFLLQKLNCNYIFAENTLIF